MDRRHLPLHRRRRSGRCRARRLGQHPAPGWCRFLLGAGETLFNTAAQAIVPAIVSRDPQRLDRANGRLQGAAIVGQQFIGPPTGGFLFSLAASLPFWINATSFAASSALLAAIPGRFRHQPQANNTTTRAASTISVTCPARVGPGLSELDRGQIIALARSDPPGRLRRQPDGTLGLDRLEEADQPAQWTLDALAAAAQAEGIQVGRS